MPLKLTGRHLHVSDETRNYVQKKIERYHKFHDRISLIEVTLSKEKRQLTADILVKAGKLDFLTSVSGEDLRVVIDQATEKIARQMEKQHDRQIDRKRHGGVDKASITPDEAGTFVNANGLPAWIHPEDVELQACTLDEALERLDKLSHRTFFIFRHAQNDAINVIFRRADGLVGLIEPEGVASVATA